MPASLIQVKSGHSTANAASVVTTVTSTGSGNLIVVGTAAAGNHTVASITDDIGNTYVQATSAAASANSNADRTDIWYVLSATSGVTRVKTNWNGTAGTFVKDSTVWEIAGFTAVVFDVAIGASNISQTNNIDDPGASGTVTTTSTDGFVAAEIKTASSGTISANPRAGNEFSYAGAIATGSDSAGASLKSSTAATHKPVWDDGNSFIDFCCSVGAFKEGGAAAATTEQLPILGAG